MSDAELLPSSSRVSQLVASLTVPSEVSRSSTSTPGTEVTWEQSGASTEEVTSDSLMSPPRVTPSMLNSTIRQKAASALLRTPSPDIRNAKGKEKRVVQVKESLDKLSDRVAGFLDRMPSGESVSSGTSSPFSGTLEFALGRVPEERRIECLMMMLQVANCYAQGKSPKISED